MLFFSYLNLLEATFYDDLYYQQSLKNDFGLSHFPFQYTFSKYLIANSQDLYVSKNIIDRQTDNKGLSYTSQK